MGFCVCETLFLFVIVLFFVIKVSGFTLHSVGCAFAEAKGNEILELHIFYFKKGLYVFLLHALLLDYRFLSVYYVDARCWMLYLTALQVIVGCGGLCLLNLCNAGSNLVLVEDYAELSLVCSHRIIVEVEVCLVSRERFACELQELIAIEHEVIAARRDVGK